MEVAGWYCRPAPSGRMQRCRCKTGLLPFREPIFETPHEEAALAQERNGFERKDAVRATAVSHDLPTLGQFRKPPLQLCHWNVERAGDMAEFELVLRPDIQHNGGFRLQAPGKLCARHRLELVEALEI